MKRAQSGPCLSAVFVDFDNIYLSLKRKNDEAARRFTKDTVSWLQQIEQGKLITPTNNAPGQLERRLVMSRCYGNPVPRRNGRDNSTDMNSFPFVRANFLRAGFEIADCPPLTAQLKNSSDIRMVMDIRDLLEHDTYYDEFVILSSDADFTPVLHRLRAHARRTVVFANDYTAEPYRAICDGEVREQDLISFLLEGQLPKIETLPLADKSAEQANDRDLIRQRILDEVMGVIGEADKAVPIAFLADRAQRVLGHELTVGSNWAGYGAFRTFLTSNLPENVVLSDHPPFFAYDPERHALPEPVRAQPEALAPPATQVQVPEQPENIDPAPEPGELQQSIARIHEACQAPALSPQDYHLLFELMALEINEAGLNGERTLANIEARMGEAGVQVKRDDIRFVLEVVSEIDPWLEQGASPALFAGRFKNFVITRCQAAGLSLSVDELDLIDAWFAAGFAPVQPQTNNLSASLQAPHLAVHTPAAQAPVDARPTGLPPVDYSQKVQQHSQLPSGEPHGYSANGADNQQQWADEQQVANWQNQVPEQLAHPIGAAPQAQSSYRPNAGQPATQLSSSHQSIGAADDMNQFPRIVRSQMRG